jgi:hypothetical protein
MVLARTDADFERTRAERSEQCGGPPEATATIAQPADH